MFSNSPAFPLSLSPPLPCLPQPPLPQFSPLTSLPAVASVIYIYSFSRFLRLSLFALPCLPYFLASYILLLLLLFFPLSYNASCTTHPLLPFLILSTSHFLHCHVFLPLSHTFLSLILPPSLPLLCHQLLLLPARPGEVRARFSEHGEASGGVTPLLLPTPRRWRKKKIRLGSKAVEDLLIWCSRQTKR